MSARVTMPLEQPGHQSVLRRAQVLRDLGRGVRRDARQARSRCGGRLEQLLVDQGGHAHLLEVVVVELLA